MMKTWTRLLRSWSSDRVFLLNLASSLSKYSANCTTQHVNVFVGGSEVVTGLHQRMLTVDSAKVDVHTVTVNTY